MSEPIRIAVLGAAGRMGQMLTRQVMATDGAVLSGLAERSDHPWVGRPFAAMAGFDGAPDLTVTDDPLPIIANAHAVIDFTLPAAAAEHAGLCAQAKCAHVIGSTGFAPEDLAKVAAAARHCPIVRAGNMSLGVNLLLDLTRRVSAALGEDYDVEIVETHHHHKVDAPSGTALMLGEAAAEGRGAALEDLADRGRDGATGPRRRGAIGFHAVRGGDVIGDHDVIFAGPGERIVIRHLASDRGIYARGAVRAAQWAVGQAPGEYDMRDVLGLT